MTRKKKFLIALIMLLYVSAICLIYYVDDYKHWVDTRDIRLVLYGVIFMSSIVSARYVKNYKTK